MCLCHLFLAAAAIGTGGVGGGVGEGVGVGGTTHGQSDRLRAPGSIGQSSSPSRVFKGHKMGGRTGNSNVTIASLKVVKVDTNDNLVMIKGAVPGAVNSIVELIKN